MHSYIFFPVITFYCTFHQFTNEEWCWLQYSFKLLQWDTQLWKIKGCGGAGRNLSLLNEAQVNPTNIYISFCREFIRESEFLLSFVENILISRLTVRFLRNGQFIGKGIILSLKNFKILKNLGKFYIARKVTDRFGSIIFDSWYLNFNFSILQSKISFKLRELWFSGGSNLWKS